MTTFLNKQDNAFGTLKHDITDVSATIVMEASDGAKFPASNFVVTIDSEKILVTTRTGDELTTITRGYDGSAASIHSAGADIQLLVIAKHLTDLDGAVTTLEGEMDTAQGDITTNASNLTDHEADSTDPHGATLTQTTVKTDTIIEATAAAGVTIDSLKIKDGAITTSDSIFLAHITSSGTQTGITTEVNVANFSGTVVIPSSGKALLIADASLFGAAGSTVGLSIYSSVDGLIAGNWRSTMQSTGYYEDFTKHFYMTGLTAGSHTITAKISATASSGRINSLKVVFLNV